jgi:hypothetical protein
MTISFAVVRKVTEIIAGSCHCPITNGNATPAVAGVQGVFEPHAPRSTFRRLAIDS